MANDSEHYQEHKDDPDEWGDPVPTKKPSRRLAAMISARFSPEEEELIRAEASRRGESVSSLLRNAALKECGPAPRPTPLHPVFSTNIVFGTLPFDPMATGVPSDVRTAASC